MRRGWLVGLAFGSACARAADEPPPVSVAEPPVVVEAGPVEPPAPPPRAQLEVDVISRVGWGARAPGPTRPMASVKHLTVHHTAQMAPDASSAPARMRGYQNYHISKGFPDIAYHYVIDRDGNVYEGRSLAAVGDTFTDYDTSSHVLITLDGHYETQQMTEPQTEALARMLAWGVQHFELTAEAIAPHRFHSHTVCPGRTVMERFASGALRARVDALLGSADVRLRTLDAEAAAARVQVIRGTRSRGPSR